MYSNNLLPLGRNTAQLYAEYRDDVENYNKKQQVLLQRHLRVLRRQERVADSFIRKNRREIEQIKDELTTRDDITQRSMNLEEYDELKCFYKISRHNNNNNYKYVQHTPSSSRSVMEHSKNDSFKLPPLFMKENTVHSRYLKDSEPKALSVRALKKSPRLSMDLHREHN